MARRKVEEGDVCKQGHSIEGGNAQTYMNHGVQAVRCFECNKPTSRVIKVGDVCKYGHTIEGENAQYVMRKGKEALTCRTCRAETRKRNNATYSNSYKGQQAEADVAARKRLAKNLPEPDAVADLSLPAEGAKGSGSMKSLNYLKLSKRAQRAHIPLEMGYDRVQSKCYQNPKPYMDYDEDAPPTQQEAFDLCDGCPLMVECGRFATAYRPPLGVWAGEVWLDNKVVGK